MLTPCGMCPNWNWCKEYGCTTWNDQSRAQKKEWDKKMKDLEVLMNRNVK